MNDAITMRPETNQQTGTGSASNGMPGNGAGSFDSGDLISGSEETPVVVTPDLLYKLSKKIAQLTKVIYSLNTKNDDLEIDLEVMRSSYEDKLKLCQQQLQLATTNLSQQLQQQPDGFGENGGEMPNGSSTPENGTRRRRSKTPEMDPDIKRELKKTRQCLKQTEAKVKAMEEEIQEKKYEMDRLHKEAATRQATAAEMERLQRELATLKATQALDGPFSNGDSSAKSSQLEQKIALLEQQVDIFNQIHVE